MKYDDKELSENELEFVTGGYSDLIISLEKQIEDLSNKLNNYSLTNEEVDYINCEIEKRVNELESIKGKTTTK